MGDDPYRPPPSNGAGNKSPSLMLAFSYNEPDICHASCKQFFENGRTIVNNYSLSFFIEAFHSLQFHFLETYMNNVL